MEPKNTKGTKPAAAPRSDHVIDLRTQKAQGSSSRPAGAAKSYMDAASPRAAQAPVVAPVRPAGPRRVVGATTPAKPAETAAQPTPSKVGDSEVVAVPAKRRFWSAFWRFLLLLIVLGVIVVAAVYAYVTYYQS
jgi:hypothetical protein